MDKQSNSTAVPKSLGELTENIVDGLARGRNTEIPVMYPNVGPEDDLCEAICLFKVIMRAMESASQSKTGMSMDEASDLMVVLDHAHSNLKTLNRFFGDERVPGFTSIYREIRQAEVIANWELAR